MSHFFIFAGILGYPVGKAKLKFDNNTLLVSNFSYSGNDGVAVRLHDPSFDSDYRLPEAMQSGDALIIQLFNSSSKEVVLETKNLQDDKNVMHTLFNPKYYTGSATINGYCEDDQVFSKEVQINVDGKKDSKLFTHKTGLVNGERELAALSISVEMGILSYTTRYCRKIILKGIDADTDYQIDSITIELPVSEINHFDEVRFLGVGLPGHFKFVNHKCRNENGGIEN